MVIEFKKTYKYQMHIDISLSLENRTENFHVIYEFIQILNSTIM